MPVGTKTQGVKLQLGSAASPPVFTNVAGVSGITGVNGGTRSRIDITNLDSTAREFLSGFADPGTATVNINFDEDETSHITLLTLNRNGEERDWRILFPSGSYIQFAGTVDAFPFDIALDDAVRNSITLGITGAPEFVNL